MHIKKTSVTKKLRRFPNIFRNPKSSLFPLLLAWSSSSFSATVYLPNHLSIELNHKLEKLFVIADIAIVKKPITVAQTNLALRKAEKKYPEFARNLRSDLKRFQSTSSLTSLSVKASHFSNNDNNFTENNNYGYGFQNQHQAQLSGFWEHNKYLTLNYGAILGEQHAANKNFIPEATYLSLGGNYLQIDLGYRPHLWGPFQHGDMLLSKNAPSPAGITISNPLPFGFLGFSYEFFLAELSKSSSILSKDSSQRLTGNPRLFGTHFSINPVDGFAISFNRLMQYGGADRDSGLTGIMNAFFEVRGHENKTDDENSTDFGNQLSSITTKYTFSGTHPWSIYMEYAGEDASAASDVHLGNTAIMWGIHIPSITDSVSVTIESAEWQNGWYVNSNYSSSGEHDGFTNHNSGMGHWGSNQRQFSDDVGSSAYTLQLDWNLDYLSDNFISLNIQSIENKSYSSRYERSTFYRLEYAQKIGGSYGGILLENGNDVFGNNHSKISGYIQW